MSKSKEDIIQHKKRAIRKLNNLLEGYISSDDIKSLKKVDLLSYWFEEFAEYIRQEEAFSPTRLMRYKRGDIIRVNLGFRVGSEMGGLHYAVVLDNHNDQSSKVITIVPLSSTDGKTVHPTNVDLGAELFSKASAQRDRLLDDAKKRMEELISFSSAIDSLESQISPSLGDNDKVSQAKKQLIEEQDKIEKTISIIERYDKEISKMKSGSMAVINQLTTISKQRIYTPKKSEDFLYHVSLSASAMDKINKKLIENYIH